MRGINPYSQDRQRSNFYFTDIELGSSVKQLGFTPTDI